MAWYSDTSPTRPAQGGKLLHRCRLKPAGGKAEAPEAEGRLKLRWPWGQRHSPEFKQQCLLQAQQGCAHRQEEDGGAEEDVLWAVAAPQRKRRSGEQEEAEAHEPLQGEARCCRSPSWPSV